MSQSGPKGQSSLVNRRSSANHRGQMTLGWTRRWRRSGKCELVFLDPDNGLENRSKDRCSREHCSYKDVQRFWERGASLVIYQHQHRFKRQAEQMAAIADELKGVVGTRPWYLHFQQRALFVIPSKTHHDTLKARFRRFTEDWCSRSEERRVGRIVRRPGS